MTASICPLLLVHRSMPLRLARCIAPGRRIKRGRVRVSAQRISCLKSVDPTDGQNDLFLVYLHLDSIADGVIPGAQVHQGDVIGAVGQEDATYPHLHFEFRKGGPQESRSVHPLHYLPYLNTANFMQLRLDRCNFYRDDGEKRVVRLGFALRNRREGDLQAVHVELKAAVSQHGNFMSTSMIGRPSIATKETTRPLRTVLPLEGYQKSNLKGEGLNNLQYGVLVEDIAPTIRFRETSSPGC